MNEEPSSQFFAMSALAVMIGLFWWILREGVREFRATKRDRRTSILRAVEREELRQRIEYGETLARPLSGSVLRLRK